MSAALVAGVIGYSIGPDQGRRTLRHRSHWASQVGGVGRGEFVRGTPLGERAVRGGHDLRLDFYGEQTMGAGPSRGIGDQDVALRSHRCVPQHTPASTWSHSVHLQSLPQ